MPCDLSAPASGRSQELPACQSPGLEEHRARLCLYLHIAHALLAERETVCHRNLVSR